MILKNGEYRPKNDFYFCYIFHVTKIVSFCLRAEKPSLDWSAVERLLRHFAESRRLGVYNGFFIFIANSLSIHYLFGKFTMDQLFWRTYFEFTFSFANSLGIHYFFANSLWIYYLFREFTIVPLIDRVFTLNLLSRSRIHYGFINLSRIDPEFTIFFANSLWIHYLFRKFTRDPWIFRVLTLNFLFLSRIHYEFFIFFANSLSIHYLFGKFTMDQLLFWWTYFEFTTSLANSLWHH